MKGSGNDVYKRGVRQRRQGRHLALGRAPLEWAPASQVRLRIEIHLALHRTHRGSWRGILKLEFRTDRIATTLSKDASQTSLVKTLVRCGVELT
jgi:hypothetical protein